MHSKGRKFPQHTRRLEHFSFCWMSRTWPRNQLRSPTLTWLLEPKRWMFASSTPARIRLLCHRQFSATTHVKASINRRFYINANAYVFLTFCFMNIVGVGWQPTWHDIKMAIRLCAEKLCIWNSTYTWNHCAWNKVMSENEARSEISIFSK